MSSGMTDVAATNSIHSLAERPSAEDQVPDILRDSVARDQAYAYPFEFAVRGLAPKRYRVPVAVRRSQRVDPDAADGLHCLRVEVEMMIPDPAVAIDILHCQLCMRGCPRLDADRGDEAGLRMPAVKHEILDKLRELRGCVHQPGAGLAVEIVQFAVDRDVA